MSDIIKKVLSEGTVPMLTDEGLKGVIGLYSRGDIEVSRELKLSTYEPPKTERVNKQNIACAYSEILLTRKIEGHSDTCCSMEKPWRHCAEWNKPDTKGQIL